MHLEPTSPAAYPSRSFLFRRKSLNCLILPTFIQPRSTPNCTPPNSDCPPPPGGFSTHRNHSSLPVSRPKPGARPPLSCHSHAQSVRKPLLPYLHTYPDPTTSSHSHHPGVNHRCPSHCHGRKVPLLSPQSALSSVAQATSSKWVSDSFTPLLQTSVSSP